MVPKKSTPSKIYDSNIPIKYASSVLFITLIIIPFPSKYLIRQAKVKI